MANALKVRPLVVCGLLPIGDRFEGVSPLMEDGSDTSK